LESPVTSATLKVVLVTVPAPKLIALKEPVPTEIVEAVEPPTVTVPRSAQEGNDALEPPVVVSVPPLSFNGPSVLKLLPPVVMMPPALMTIGITGTPAALLPQVSLRLMVSVPPLAMVVVLVALLLITPEPERVTLPALIMVVPV